MSNMTNTAYRKSRGTEKLFSGSEEQTKAIWNELIRVKRRQYGKPDLTAEATPKG